jgi:hypothetical protein
MDAGRRTKDWIGIKTAARARGPCLSRLSASCLPLGIFSQYIVTHSMMVLPSRVSAGVPGLRMLFVIFTLLSLASSFPFHPDRLDSRLNSVDAPRHVKRDVYTFPRVTYGDTCSEAQKTYIEQELNEMIDLVSG